jgi:uncharacterized protein (TIGR00369 family)
MSEFQIPEGFVNEDEGLRFVTHIGPIYKRYIDGKLTDAAILVEQKHANLRGVVHGGMMVALADHALSRIVSDAANKNPCTTISLNSDFVAGAKVGDWVVATGEVTKTTRSLVFVRGTVMTGDKLLMTASGVWKRLGAD